MRRVASPADPAPQAPAAWCLALGRQAWLTAPDGRTWLLDGLVALLAAWLALAGPQPRDQAARHLWPHTDTTRARGNLRQRLLRLKVQAGWPWIDGQDALALAPTLQLRLLSNEPLLPELAEPADDTLALWLQGARRSWQQAQSGELQQRLHQAEARQDLDAALALATEWVALQPAAEQPRRALARVHYLRNDRGSALQELDALAAMLQRVHAAEASAATRELRRLIERSQAEPPRGETPAVLLRPPRLVGRDAELAQLRQALAARTPCLLVGEAGLGKSRLMAEALADRPDALLVKAQAGDAGVPYATVARLLRRLIETRPTALPAGPAAGALARLLPELQATPAAAAWPARGGRLALHEALRALWHRSGVRTVALDDLHFADEASLELLQPLLADDRLADVAWLLSRRPAEGPSALAALSDALMAARRLHTVLLAPLDEGGVAELLTSLQLGLDGSWAQRLHRHTGGNPLFLLETLQQLQAADVAQGRLPPSATVAALIDRRLKDLSPAAMALARVAALAGPDFNAELAEQVSGKPALDLADAWAELQAAQVLRGQVFAHDLVLEAVLRGIPQPIARHLQGAVARCLQSQGGEPARLAAHWLAAGDEPQAVPWLSLAAERAAAALRPREACGFLVQAVEIAARTESPATPMRLGLLMRLFDIEEVIIGTRAALPRLQQAAQAAHAAHSIDNAASLLRVQARRAQAALDLIDIADAVERSGQALQQALARGADDVAADMACCHAQALVLADRLPEAERVLQAHWPLVESLPEPQSHHFGARASVLDDAGRPHEARPYHLRGIAIARAQGHHAEVVAANVSLAVGHVFTGTLDAADACLDEAERLRQTLDDAGGGRYSTTSVRATVARLRGRYAQALDLLGQAIETDSDQRTARLPVLRLRRALVWALIGQWTRAQQDLAADGYPGLPSWVSARAAWLRAELAAARGQPADAAWAPALALARQDSGMLRTMREPILGLAALRESDAAVGLLQAQRLHGAAETDGLHGLRWSHSWTCALLALRAGQPALARLHAKACLQRPEHQPPGELGPGRWWHGLWQVGLALGDHEMARAAREQGLAWIQHTLQRELPSAFHASFCDAVAVHRALLAGVPLHEMGAAAVA